MTTSADADFQELTSGRLTAAGFTRDDPALTAIREWNRAAAERGVISVELRRGQFGATRRIHLDGAP